MDPMEIVASVDQRKVIEMRNTLSALNEDLEAAKQESREAWSKIDTLEMELEMKEATLESFRQENERFAAELEATQYSLNSVRQEYCDLFQSNRDLLCRSLVAEARVEGRDSIFEMFLKPSKGQRSLAQTRGKLDAAEPKSASLMSSHDLLKKQLVEINDALRKKGNADRRAKAATKPQRSPAAAKQAKEPSPLQQKLQEKEAEIREQHSLVESLRGTIRTNEEHQKQAPVFQGGARERQTFPELLQG
ncbi:hypothetical protein INS49_003971 [Diaporthe citri]|uniref:uncharacterized protein n=1 Tax=Diaporthe citri TaxID=83186 RepID=UPI001C7FF599|nr:uncharacterized protein INS49_003971 [Diaporthe citri]KAG6354890.1 hypothetical protein INS49_003971 [Diaporthe citri]